MHWTSLKKSEKLRLKICGQNFFFNIISLRCVNADRKVQRILVFGDSADLSPIGQI